MSDKNKPMTAAEVEELKALEEKATPGPWESGQHPAMSCGGIIKPVTFGMRVKVLPECEGGHVVLREEDAALIAAMRNALPRLLSMLTPPPDAAVREAVEQVELKLEGVPENPSDTSLSSILDMVRVRSHTLRTLLRAVQAPQRR